MIETQVCLGLVLAIIVLFGVAFGLALWIGSARWSAETPRIVGRLPSWKGKIIDARYDFAR